MGIILVTVLVLLVMLYIQQQHPGYLFLAVIDLVLMVILYFSNMIDKRKIIHQKDTTKMHCPNCQHKGVNPYNIVDGQNTISPIEGRNISQGEFAYYCSKCQYKW